MAAQFSWWPPPFKPDLNSSAKPKVWSKSSKHGIRDQIITTTIGGGGSSNRSIISGTTASVETCSAGAGLREDGRQYGTGEAAGRLPDGENAPQQFKFIAQ